MKPVLYALILTIPLVLAPAQASEASTPSLTVAMDAASYSLSALALAGDAPTATVTLVDGEGAPMAGVAVRVVVIRQLPLVGFVGNETFLGTTDADGVFQTAVGTASMLPSDYVVVARAAGLLAQTRYTVDA